MDDVLRELEDAFSDLNEENRKAINDLKESQTMSRSLFEAEGKRLAE